MKLTKILILFFSVWLLNTALPSYPAQGGENVVEHTSEAEKSTEAAEKLVSLTELVPVLTPVSDYSGNFWDRYTLWGNFDGNRQQLYDRGVAFDVTFTQVYQGVVSGGADDDEWEYHGLLEYGLALDTAKLGWWPGGLLVGNISTSFGNTLISETGNISPVNYNNILPTADPSDTFPMEYYLTQALPTKTLVTIGRLNAANFLDRSRFANDRKSQFLNAANSNNLMMGSFLSFSTYAGLVVQPINEHLAIYGAVFDPNLTPDDYIPDGGLFSDIGVGGGADIRWALGNGLKGSLNPVFIYSNKNTAEVDNPHYPLSPLVDLVIPINVPSRSDNWVVIATLDQYLWKPDNAKTAAPSADRPHPAADYAFQEPGVGLALRGGYGPEDGNPWNTFISGAISGRGVIPGRPYDRFGIGAYAMFLSEDFDDLVLVGDVLDDEFGVEAFYNVAFTPAVHLTLDIQRIEPGIKGTDDTWVLGSRLFTRF
ncbi:MAG: carbohydrate porin [bacterium]|nr:carbohydrate porin [bacterium]